MLNTTYSVPGIYHQPQPRESRFPRLRTDVVGFVGVAGAKHLHEAVRIDDWRSYEQEFMRDERGDELAPPSGTQLYKAVRDFFANGGARCWVVNIAQGLEQSQAQVLLNTMFGLTEMRKFHGLELLLRQTEVSLVVLPELDASIEGIQPAATIPGIGGPYCFVACADIPGPVPPGQLPSDKVGVGRLFTHSQILWAQRYLITRIQREAWRWFAILSPPDGLDQAQVIEWREALTQHMDEVDCAALYWPWVLAQDKPGAPVEKRSPVGFVAGIFARRDLEAGPHSAPANERMQAVVGLERSMDDAINAMVYDRGINVIRSFPGRGINVWGARTLMWQDRMSRTKPLSFINARRCLSAIERTAEQIGQQVVFEPHSPLLRVQLSQAIVGYLLTVYNTGALLGGTADEAFFVRCDSNNNPPELVEQGRLICEIGVALAAPAEFIVFRMGRQEGVTEIEEVT